MRPKALNGAAVSATCAATRSAFPFVFFFFLFFLFSFFFFSFSFFPFSFFLEQRAPRERAPSSELRLEGKGVKRTRETVVPFAKLKKEFQAKNLENVLLYHIHVDEMKKS